MAGLVAMSQHHPAPAPPTPTPACPYVPAATLPTWMRTTRLARRIELYGSFRRVWKVRHTVHA